MEILKNYSKRYRKDIILGLFFLSIETILSLLIFLILGNIIDYGVRREDLAYIYSRGFIMLGVTLLMALSTVLRNRYSSIVSQSFGADLRFDLYRKVQRLSFTSLNKYERSEFITRLTSDVSQVQAFVHSLLRIFFKAPLLALGSIILSLVLSPKLSLVLVFLLPLTIYLIYRNLHRTYPLFKKIQGEMDRMNLVLNEYLSAIQLVKSFNMEDYEGEKFKEANQSYRDANIQALNIIGVFSPLLTLIVNLGLVLIIYLGGISVSRGGMEIGIVVALINYMGQILFGLLVLNSFLNRGLRAKTSLDRIGEIFRLEEEDLSLGQLPKNLDIEFKAVSLKYETAKSYALKDINFSLREGERLAIIGGTGSGKSSLIRLVLGFYKPSKGKILIGGEDLETLDIKYIRDKIALVSQESYIFSGTIRENISLGSSENIQEAARLAEADQFIESFKEGYDTRLGEAGVNLSGGQKQRVGIARSLGKKPRILVLDDSSSNLDLIVEKRLRENIENSPETKGLIVISQRIQSVKNFENILVLDKGEIEAFGNHEKLMKDSRVYRDIYLSQIGEVD